MRVLILSDTSIQESIGQTLDEKLITEFKDSDYDYKHYNVKDAEMEKCIGCFTCWLKTPGICIFNDITRDITKDDLNSDVFIILSEIKYGGHSPQIKRVLDRSIGKVLPFFKEVNGEMHHAPRYEKYPELIFIGYGSDISSEEKDTFEDLNKAIATNFQKDKAETYICQNSEEVKNSILAVLQYLKLKEAQL